MHVGQARPTGTVGLNVIRAGSPKSPVVPSGGVWDVVPHLNVADILHFGTPQKGEDAEVNAWRKANAPHLMRGLRDVLAFKALPKKFRRPTMFGVVWHRVLRADGSIVPLGLASVNLVTDDGVAFIVDAFTNAVEAEAMNYHGIGTGATAEAQTDSALVTELTTQYNPDNTRATGSQSQPSANVYRTVGTNTVDASVGIQEHGIFSQAATGGGVLLDRSVFTVINLTSGDSLESTYDFTVTAGG